LDLELYGGTTFEKHLPGIMAKNTSHGRIPNASENHPQLSSVREVCEIHCEKNPGMLNDSSIKTIANDKPLLLGLKLICGSQINIFKFSCLLQESLFHEVLCCGASLHSS
jgi:hypothetical protein